MVNFCTINEYYYSSKFRVNKIYLKIENKIKIYYIIRIKMLRIINPKFYKKKILNFFENYLQSTSLNPRKSELNIISKWTYISSKNRSDSLLQQCYKNYPEISSRRRTSYWERKNYYDNNCCIDELKCCKYYFSNNICILNDCSKFRFKQCIHIYHDFIHSSSNLRSFCTHN